MTKPLAVANSGVQAGSDDGQTSTSPGGETGVASTDGVEPSYLF